MEVYLIMRKYTYLIFIWFLLFLSCEKDSTAPPSNSNEYSIIGKIVDQASGQGLTATLVKIVNNQNAYQTTTGDLGSFGFQNVTSGDYLLTVEISQNGEVLSDTCGNYNTDTPDWGTIYSQTFATISGIIKLEGEDDHSFINVQLLGTDKSAVTTNQGKFRIDFIFPDTYDLYISKDDNYKEIRINDLLIHQGEIFKVDTTMKYRFKPLILKEVTDLSFLTDKDAGFCFANGHFWITNIKGLLKYDPLNNIEEQVYILYNSEPYSGIYYLGEPYVTYDYNDGIWLTMDEPNEWYYRKYSIINGGIIDSVKVNSLPTHYPFRIAYDPINDGLILIESYTAFYPNIHTYNLQNHSVETVNLQLEEYDFNNYKSIKVDQIFIDPNGKVYFTLETIYLDDKKDYHLYVCNNLTDLNLIQIYKFPDFYNFSGRLSFYNNDLYAIYRNNQPTIGGKVFKLIF